MVELSNELQLKPSSAHHLAPYADLTPLVAREDEVTLKPIVACYFVTRARKDTLLRAIPGILSQKQVAVQCVDTYLMAMAKHNVARHIVDGGTLYRELVVQLA